jgi:5,6-dimethylbenzimidazole synthase
VLDPAQLNRDLQVPADWHLVGYFCIGHPEELSDSPELGRKGWENRQDSLKIETR